MIPLDTSLLPLTALVRDDGRLNVGGVDMLGVAQRFGTPLFVYDEEHLRRRLREARTTFGEGTAYATKAFLCKAVARIAYEEGLSLDVSTGGEYQLCRDAGIPAHRLVLHGNSKRREELVRAVEEGVQWIVIDNLDEISLLTGIVEELGRDVSVLVRVNPGTEVHTHHFLATGNRGSKFGIPLWNGDAEAAVRSVERHPRLRLRGIHIHVGSQVFSIDTFLSALDEVIPFVLLVDPEVFVIGGGLGVRYLKEDEAPSLRGWGEQTIQHCRVAGVQSRILAEPGRAIVASAALTLYTLCALTTRGERTFAVVDGGMMDNPRPQLYGSDYESFLVREVTSDRDLLVTMVGRHCESSDTIITNAWLPSTVTVGDIVSTPVTGAYGYVMGSNYNMFPRPAVVLVREGQVREIIRRQTYGDLITTDVG